MKTGCIGSGCKFSKANNTPRIVTRQSQKIQIIHQIVGHTLSPVKFVNGLSSKRKADDEPTLTAPNVTGTNNSQENRMRLNADSTVVFDQQHCLLSSACAVSCPSHSHSEGFSFSQH